MTAPAAVESLVLELIEQAKRLGLVWTLQLGTMHTDTTVTVDGDAVPIPVVNLVGAPQGARVSVVTVPPAGAYVTAVVDRPMWANEAGSTVSLGSGITTSAAYADLPGTPTLSLVKRYAQTRLRFDIATTFFVTNAQAGALFGAGVTTTGGGDFDLARYEDTLPALGARLQATGFAYVAGIPAGQVSVVARWLRTSGTGTLNVNGDDWISLSVREVT